MANDLTVQKETTAVTNEVFSDFTAFENAQRIGKMLTQSKIIPASYQNSLPDVMVAMEIACRNRLSPIVVMQNLNVIKGRPAWSSKYIIAALTSTRVNNLHYEMSSNGKVAVGGGFGKGTDIENLMCRAIANDRQTGEERVGPWVTMKMAVDEGWYGKDGSKWKTMPEVMIRYRAATFFASVYYPELSVGIDTEDEPDKAPQYTPAPVEVVESGAIVEPAAEAPAKKRKKTEPKKAEPETPEVKDASFEEVPAEVVPEVGAEVVAEAPKPAAVVTPQADDSDEWDSWED